MTGWHFKSRPMITILFYPRKTERSADIGQFRKRSLPRRVLLTIFLLPLAVFSLASNAVAGGRRSVEWMQLSPASSPPPRSYLAMAYDAISARVIMFGGVNGTGYLNDTWSFDGSTWTKIGGSEAPSRRANAQMAYDSIRGKIVLFGGYNGSSYLGDTWIWNGATSQWTKANPIQSPTAVTGPMVFTLPGGAVGLFGGFDGRFYQAGFWRWNGSNWIRLTPAMVPYSRASAAVALNPLEKEVVLFGGLADINPVNTWTYQGSNWTMESPPVQPLWVYSASAAYDSVLNAIILFGGGSGGVDQNTTWAWIRSDWRQLRTMQSPPAREGAGMAYDAAIGRIVLFGGQDNVSYLNDTWEFNP